MAPLHDLYRGHESALHPREGQDETKRSDSSATRAWLAGHLLRVQTHSQRPSPSRSTHAPTDLDPPDSKM